jgi:hypothetical protein
MLSFRSLGLIALALIILSSAAFAYTITGNSITYANEWGSITEYPHTIRDVKTFVYVNATSNLTGTNSLDFAFGFDTTKITPVKAWYWNINAPHIIPTYGDINQEETVSCLGTSAGIINTTAVWCFYSSNSTNLTLNCPSPRFFPNSTSCKYNTTTWKENGTAVSVYPDWVDISTLFTLTAYGGKTWYTIPGTFTQGETKQLKAEIWANPNTQAKYDLAIKRSADTWASTTIYGGANPAVLLDPWANTSFDIRQNFTLNSSVSTTLINFTTNLTVNHSALVAQGCLANGSDIRILNDSNYVHNFEIDSGNNTSSMQVWVLIPSFPNGIGAGNKNYSVTLYCKNNTAVADGQNPTQTWAQYTDVYHFESTKNSATGQFNLNTTGSPTFQTAYCKYGTCLNTSAGAATGTLLTSSLYYAPTNLYIECWARRQTNTGTYVKLVGATQTTDADANWGLMTWTGTGLDNMILYHVTTEVSASAVVVNTMEHWVGVYNNTSGRIWKDGNSVWLYAPFTRNQSATIFLIGGIDTAAADYWNGVVDECRFSTNIADKTADWINASRSAFSTAGAIESNAAPLTVTWLNQTPTNLTQFNAIVIGLNATYNISVASSTDQIDLTKTKFYHKTNTSATDCTYFINGTSYCGYLTSYVTVSNTSASLYSYGVSGNGVYRATYNQPEDYVSITPHITYTLNNSNQYISNHFFNFSSSIANQFLELMVYAPGASTCRVYYCNSSYAFGSSPATSTFCANAFTVTNSTLKNHTHSAYSYHMVIPFGVNTTAGTFNNIKITEGTSYIVVRGDNAGTCSLFGVSNTTLANNTQISTNNGNAWANLVGTPDTHLHYTSTSDTIRYYLEVFTNGTSNNNTNSSITIDALEYILTAPTAPSIYSPVEGSSTTIGANLTINYTASIPGAFAFIQSYNLTLVNTTGSFVKGIVNLTNASLGYSWNTTGVTTGSYRVLVVVYDNNTMNASSFSEIFTITSPIPTVTNVVITKQPACTNLPPYYTTDVLTCEAKSSDNSVPTLNVSTRFYRNGTLYTTWAETGITANTTRCSYFGGSIDAPYVTKSDTWICGVTAFNGVANSTEANSTGVTINNTAPVIGVPTINNTSPIISSILLCNNGSFTDGDAANNTYYKWYKNNVLIAGNTSSTLNLTIAGAAYGDTINCSMIRSDSGYDMKNSSETYSTSVRAQAPPWTTDTEICEGAGCSTLTTIYVDTSLNCRAYVYDNDSVTIQEMRFNWRLNGSIDHTRYNYSVDNASRQYQTGSLWANPAGLPGLYFGKSDTIYCESRAYDSLYYSSYVPSTAYTVNNSAPTAATPTVNNYNPSNISTITCTGGISYTDKDNDTQNATYYLWYRNGASTGNTTAAISLTTLNASDGDVLYCESWVEDTGYQQKNSTRINSSAVTVGIIPVPTITDCTTGFNVLNFSVLDEQTFTPIYATMEATFTLYNISSGAEFSNVSFYIQNRTSFAYCIYPYAALTLVNSYQTYYPFTGTAYAQRNYYLFNSTLDASAPQNINIYLLNSSVSTDYTFQVVNQYSVPLSGVKLTMYRFMPTLNAWVVIEQQVTDFSGYSLFNLQAGTLYRLVATANGYVTLSTDFTPGAVTSIQIRLTQTSGTVTPVPNYEQVFNDVTYKILPTVYFHNSSTYAEFEVSSASSSLTNYSMVITRRYNGTTAIVFNTNVTSSPGGGILNYTATLPGEYTLQISFKHANYTQYTPVPTTFFIGNSSGASLAIDVFATGFMNGWAFYFIAVVCAMLAAGFALRFSPEASGAVGLLVLWCFTYLYPVGVIVTVAGVGITVLMATILTTLMVGAVMFLKWYV